MPHNGKEKALNEIIQYYTDMGEITKAARIAWSQQVPQFITFNQEKHGHLFPKNDNFKFIPPETCVPHGEDIIPSDVTHKDIL